MSWTAATEAFAEALPGYESRTEQDSLATAVEASLADRAQILAQAGCGTGKSFANLVPAIAHALRVRKPVVVSTATKALQGQYVDKDLPFLHDVLADTFGDFRYALLKGRGNYVCKAKLFGEDSADVFNHAQLVEELEREDHDGDMERLVTEIAPADKGKLTSSGEECPGKKKCPFGDVCFAEYAKARAADAQIVVANHALLVRDLLVREATNGVGSILPEYDAVIIDEAHELEDYTTSALSVELSENGVRRFADDVEKLTGEGNTVPGAAVKLFAEVTRVLARNTTLALDDRLLADLFPAIEELLNEVVAVQQAMDFFRPTTDDEAMRRKQLMRRGEGLSGRLMAMLGLDESGPEIVRWIEREDRQVRGQTQSTVKLFFSPLHVGPFLAANLWTRPAADDYGTFTKWELLPSVLTSATLAVGSDFSYLTGRLGLTELAPRNFDAGTPFNFAKQAALYIPEGTFPEPTGRTTEEWTARSFAEMGELIREAGGRTLALFTSRKNMIAAHRALSGTLAKRGITVLIQSPGMSTGKLAEEFIADETSVLFALKSFMTGFDAQGDTLRLVILDKLPFAVPTDVMLSARAAAIDAVARNKWVDGSFPTMTVPSMALTLLQAFGRAVRTRNDEAMIAIFDPRLRTKKYGKTIMNALPPAKQVNGLSGATAHLADLHLRRD